MDRQAPPHAGAAALRRPDRARDASARARPRRRARWSAAPRHLAAGARDRLQASGALTFAGLEPAPATPLNVKVGPHRRYTWVDAELARAARDQGLARRDRQRRRARRRRRRAGSLPAPPRRRHARPRAQGAGSDLRARRGARKLGNVVAPLAAPLPVGIEDPVEQYHAIRDDAERARRHARGGRRAHAHRARRLRVADDHEPGRAPAAQPALLQPRRHERPRPAVPAVPARPAAARAVPGRPDHRPPGARRSRS